jgi:hypothetical protein
MKNSDVFGVLNGEFIYFLTITEDKKFPGKTYLDWCPDCKNHKHKDLIHKKFRSVYDDMPQIEYKLNNYGFRSDDFLSSESSQNILFGGCSNTFGIGLPNDFTWSNQFNKIHGGLKYISIAVNGSTADVIISNVNTYINKIGKPKGIVLLFPNIERVTVVQPHTFYDDQKVLYLVSACKMYQYDQDSKETITDLDISKNYLLLRFYQNVYALELLCKSLDIPLMWSTWDHKLNNDIRENFFGLLNDYVDLYNKKYFSNFADFPALPNSPYVEASRDGHPSGETQRTWAAILSEAWKQKFNL